MRGILLAAGMLAAGMLAISVSAASGDDVMAGFYGNTAIATGGRAETHTVFNADHTFVLNVPIVSQTYRGTWAVNGATLCRTYEVAPPGVANPLCTPVEPHKVGDTWTMTMNGQTRTVTLVKGIQ